MSPNQYFFEQDPNFPNTWRIHPYNQPNPKLKYIATAYNEQLASLITKLLNGPTDEDLRVIERQAARMAIDDHARGPSPNDIMGLVAEIDSLRKWKDAAEMFTNAVAIHGIDEVARRLK